MTAPVKDIDDLRERLGTALPRLHARYGVRALSVFGSFVRGAQTAESDIDLLVDLRRPLGLAFLALSDDLEALLGRPVDLGSARSLRPAVRAQVLRDAVRVASA